MADTLSADLANIDVVNVAGRIYASAVNASAFIALMSHPMSVNPDGFFAQADVQTWATMTEGTAPTPAAFVPTPRTFLTALHASDARFGPIAAARARSAGMTPVDAIVNEGRIGYANYVDGLAAANWAESKTANEFGSATTVLSLGLIDAGLAALIAAGAPAPYGLVIHSNLIPQLLSEPSIREMSVLGPRGGALSPVTGSPSNRLLVANYANSLDIFHSDQIAASAGARMNMMFSVGTNDQEKCLGNPWTPIDGPMGLTGQAMLVDVQWNHDVRSWGIYMTTFERVQGTVFTNTTNGWMSTLATDDLV